jgi:hypothetical protein
MKARSQRVKIFDICVLILQVIDAVKEALKCHLCNAWKVRYESS